MSIIDLNYLGVRFCLGSAANLVHLPEDVFERFLLFIVHRRYLLRIIGVGIGFDGVDDKHIFPNRTASAHFKFVIADRVLYILQPAIVIDINFLNDRLRSLSCP